MRNPDDSLIFTHFWGYYTYKDDDKGIIVSDTDVIVKEYKG